MKKAVLNAKDKNQITADEAAVRNERRAFCPHCKKPVRLHESKKIANHFEHLNRTGRCPLEY